MSVSGRLAVLALRPLADGAALSFGRTSSDLVVEKVDQFLTRQFLEQRGLFSDALRRIVDRSWKAIEIALSGTAWLRQVANSTDKSVIDLLSPFLQQVEPEIAKHETKRRLALAELKAARKKNLLSIPAVIDEEMAKGLARGTALYAQFESSEEMLMADRSAIRQIGDELAQVGCPNLARVLLPPSGDPLLGIVSRYFLRTLFADHPRLAEALEFARPDDTSPEFQKGLVGLHDAIVYHSRRLEELLGNVATTTAEPSIPTLDLSTEQAGPGAAHSELYRAVQELQQRFNLANQNVGIDDENAVSHVTDRQQALSVIDRYRALPQNSRQSLPALLNAIGLLQIAIGDSGTAVRDFQTAAELATDPTAKGLARLNAHRAALTQPDYATAMKEFLEAVKLDGRRFATFPVGKYLPVRIIDYNQSAIAYLCKHKYMNSQIVVKTFSPEGVDRDIEDIFSESQALSALNHPAINRVQDCGYVDVGKKQRPFLVLDWFDGMSLDEYVAKCGPLPADDLVALFAPVASALEAALSKRILHRDIRPANLLVNRLAKVGDKPRWEVKILNFGIGQKQSDSADNLSIRHSTNRNDYASPEQLGKLPGVEVGPSSDIYNFAKTCCFALFQTTFPSPTHWSILPAWLSRLLRQCLNDDPKDRPKDFATISRQFASFNPAADAPAAAPPTFEVVEQPAVVPVVPSAPAPRAKRGDLEAKYKRLTASQNSGQKVLVAVLGVLALLLLLFCGGGIGIWYFAFHDSSEVAEKEPPSTTKEENPDEPIGLNPQPAQQPNQNGPNGFIPRQPRFPIQGGPPNVAMPANKPQVYQIKITGIPTKLVADFIVERFQASKDDIFGPQLKKCEKNGNDVLVAMESRSDQIDRWLRSLNLGTLIRNDDDSFRIDVVPPPPPMRSPPVNDGLTELTALEFKEIVAAIRVNRNVDQVVNLLLQRSPKDEQQSTIRLLLRAKVADPFIGKKAIEALGIWGTAEDVPFLIGLSGPRAFINDVIIKALGRLRDPSAVPFLVKMLGQFGDGDKAVDALRAIGPAAEKDVQSALSSTEHDVRRRACIVLKDIGSTDSLPLLKTAARDHDRAVAEAAWETCRILAFHPVKPSVPDSNTPIAAKPKTTMMLDDLKVTELDEKAAGILPNMIIAGDGQSFYTLEAGANIRRMDWDGQVQASIPARSMTLMALSSRALVLASSTDVKLLDTTKLSLKSTGPLDKVRWLTSSPAIDFGVARCEGSVASLPVLDLNTFSIAYIHADKRIPGLKSSTYTIMPSSVFKNDPTLTPNGQTLFTQGDGRLQRWSVSSFKLSPLDTSATLCSGDAKIIVSPDNKYVALLAPTGNSGDPGNNRPLPAGSTAIFSTSTLRKPVFIVQHGAKPTALAFDSKGHVWAGTANQLLIHFDADGSKIKEYNLGGIPRQIIADHDAKRLLILTKDKLLRIDLPMQGD
jgi:serine/threonine protein kinase